jgi:hypothetical protein
MSVRRRSALVGLAIATVLVIVAQAAQAASMPITSGSLTGPPLGLKPLEPAEQLTVVMSRSKALESLNPAAVSYYEKQYGVSEAVARERLATQVMAPNLGAVLAQHLGKGYSDVWFDNSTGQWVLDVTSSAATTEAETLMHERNLEGTYRLVRVPFDHEQLEGAARRTAQRLRGLTTAGLASVGEGAGKVNVILASTVTPEQRDEAEGAKATISSESGTPPVGITDSTEASLAAKPHVGCSWRYCNTLIGGDHWYGSGVGCTMSYFVAIKGREPWVPSMLTAGHCLAGMGGLVKPAETCEPGETPCGQWGLTLTFFEGDGHGDAGLIDDYSGQYSGPPAFAIYGGYWNWSISTVSKLESYYTSAPPTGLTVCKQGSGKEDPNKGGSLGSSCGTISEDGVTEHYGGLEEVNLFKVVNARACDGDSGSPIDSASSDTAVGILDSGNENEGSGCGSTSESTTIGEAISFWNLTVYGGAWGPW